VGPRIVFVDSSVFVAILSDEEDALDFLVKLQHEPAPMTSGLVILESAMRLSSKLNVDPFSALSEIEALLEEARITVMPIDAEHGRLAVGAFAKYGKGRGHPAQLNLADCLSYACAMGSGVPLLFKGNDFSQTDISKA